MTIISIVMIWSIGGSQKAGDEGNGAGKVTEEDKEQ